MDLLAALTRIASADPVVRREQLLAMLREMDVPFTHYRQSFAAHRPENIVVSLGNEPNRYVIGAHYDNVRGSTGANDNGAGVAVLLALLENPPDLSIDFVFFDLEEAGLIGSQAYLEQVGTEHILGMINLDICGVGDTLVAAAGQHTANSPLLASLQQIESSRRHVFQLIERIPPGDDVSFEKSGLPTATCAIVPQDDIELLIDMARCIQLQIPMGAVPSIAETMHNGPRDTIDVIDAVAMHNMLNFAQDLLTHLQEAR